MLLNHRSGLPDYTKWVPNYTHDMRTPVTNEQMIALMATHVLPLSEIAPALASVTHPQVRLASKTG